MVINISKKDLEGLESFESGKFGNVYKKDDKTVYKVYQDRIADDLTGIAIDNPSLLLSQAHFNRLISRSKKLKYSDGITDVLHVDGKFGGVVLPFYDGEILANLMDEPFKVKVDLSRQFVRNAKELSSHLIYSTDYKLNNAILVGDEVKLIDFDDVKTHVSVVPNPLYHLLSVNMLGDAIQTFFRQYSHFHISRNITKHFGRERAFEALSYKRINDYIDKKSIEVDVVFINFDSDIHRIIELSKNKNLKFVLVVDNYVPEGKSDFKDKILEFVLFLEYLGITLYDIEISAKTKDYHTIENVKEEFILDGENSQLKRIYKRGI